MRRILVVVVGSIFVLGCRSKIADAVEKAETTGSRRNALADPSLFDAGWVDDGGILVGCERSATPEGVPAECTPSPSGCAGSADCPSGLCLALTTGHVCTRTCATNASCDPGWVCQLRWTGAGQQGFCVPAPACHPRLACDPGQCGVVPDGCGGVVTCDECTKGLVCDLAANRCDCAGCGVCGGNAPCPDGSCPGVNGCSGEP
jgi:hypothetical protein